MDSTPRVSLFDSKPNPDVIIISSPPSSASTGSLPIRAPITLDDDESGFESDGYKTGDSDISSSYSSGSGFQIESEGFASGEEGFETASERHFVGDPDEETVEESGVYARYDISRPFVADPDENWSENDTEEEEDGRSAVIDGCSPVLDNPNPKLAMPIAHLSMDEEFDELLGDEEILSEVEDVIKVPDFVVKEGIDASARVKALEVEKVAEDEPMELKDSSFTIQSEGDLSMKVADGVISGNFVEVHNGVVGSENTVGFPEDYSQQGGKEDVLEENLKIKEDACFAVKECRELENMEHERNDLNCMDRNEIEITWSDINNHPSRQIVESELFEGCASATHVKEQNAIVMSNGVEHSLLGIELDDASEAESLDVVTEGNEIKMDVFEVSRPNQTQENGELHEVVECKTLEDALNGVSSPVEFVTPISDISHEAKTECGLKENHSSGKIVGKEGVLSDEYMEELISATSKTTLQDTKEVGQTEVSTCLLDPEGCQYDSGIIDGLDAEEEVNMYEDVEGKELLVSATLDAILKAVKNAEMYNGGVTADGPEVISLEGPAGSSASFQSGRSTPPHSTIDYVSKKHVSEEEKKRIEEIQLITVRFLRLVWRLGLSHEDPMVVYELDKLTLAIGANLSQTFDLESAKRMATELEGEGKDDLGISLNILVLGKTGVGKSATINSIFGEQKVMTDAFAPATTKLKEIVGMIDGVKIRILDTPGLRSSAREESINRKMLASTKKYIKKFPPDVVLYVDRLDACVRDPGDLPLLKSLTNSIGSSIWKKAIVTLTHATSAPVPDGPSESPLSFDAFVTKRSTLVKQAISQAVGDLFLMNPNIMHQVSLVENHPTYFKNGNGESVLPNGECWRPQLLLLCYSLKILSEASSLLKRQDTLNPRKRFGFGLRPLHLPHLVSSLLQSWPHPKLSTDQGGEVIISHTGVAGLSDSDEDGEDEYDRLPPFKPLRKSMVPNLDKEQIKVYFEEYDYQVANLQSRFSIGRSSKMAVRVGLNNNQSGKITVKVSSLEQFQIIVLGILPIAVSIFRSMFSGS
ncbi:translocase of chloroplast chloroplastic-like [Tripterygium wilfordii]|uniref:Translocase of chloroplast chloroplastic-like n=1 Tax=Tripterygium wilfordii TaxID=458696 RepID=A0A7J7CSP7_TRIWF|nr:translocase of chloroplast 159, chloroplastic-like [Tripterygium wilfordii]KAF5736989.1 translocase of chloroplast chloroplastic-like [Tripterygium wilfordii]